MKKLNTSTCSKNELILPPGREQESEIAPSNTAADVKFVFCTPSCFSLLPQAVYPTVWILAPVQAPASCPFSLFLTLVSKLFLYPCATLTVWLIFHLFNIFLTLQDCFCTSRTQVESLRPEKQSETSTHQNLVRKWLSTNVPLLPPIMPFYRM